MKKSFIYFVVPVCLSLVFFCVTLIAILFNYELTQPPLFRHRLILSAGGCLVLVILLLFFCWKKIFLQARYISNLTSVAENLNLGSFSQRFDSSEGPASELSRLSQSLNLLMSKAEKKMVALQQQSFEKEAVLSSMSEAVMAVNKSEEIYLMNEAAAELFSMDYFADNHRTLAEVVRIPKLYNKMIEALQQSKTIDEEFRIDASLVGQMKKPLYLRIKSSPIKGRKKQDIGAVFVFNNNTKIKELEKHRTSFVGNVSHELKTPLTLIQGFTETLLENPSLGQEDRSKYISVIHKHSSRLGHLIDDLLAISKLENESEKSGLDFDLVNLTSVLRNAISLCQEKAKNKNIQLGLSTDADDVNKKINVSLFEQALVNLIDNAIKHSTDNSKVEVSLIVQDQLILIDVKDQGAGIEQKHLDRIFERFYRVDKGRSRDVGGTGLGLSIVKHVVQLHGGKISVMSELGLGSQFRIELPKW